MDNKGQAALEFLTTYGWAFLIILVMVGGFTYFGVLDASSMSGEDCISSPEFTCQSKQITDTQQIISMRNNFNENIVVVNASIFKNNEYLKSCVADNSVYSESSFQIYCVANLTEGKRENLMIKFYYYSAGGSSAYSKENIVRLRAKVQSDSEIQQSAGWFAKPGSVSLQNFIIGTTSFDLKTLFINSSNQFNMTQSFIPMGGSSTYNYSNGVLTIAGRGLNYADMRQNVNYVKIGQAYMISYESKTTFASSSFYLDIADTTPAISDRTTHSPDFKSSTYFITNTKNTGFIDVNLYHNVTAPVLPEHQAQFRNVKVLEVSPLDSLMTGTQYFQAPTAGTMYLASNQAYGTWEFDVYRASGSNEILVGLIADSLGSGWTSNYSFAFRNNGLMQILKNGNILSSSVGSYSHSVWWGIKMTRDQNGRFLVKLKSRVSPYTTIIDRTDNSFNFSNYLILDLDAGDRVANIRLSPVVE